MSKKKQTNIGNMEHTWVDMCLESGLVEICWQKLEYLLLPIVEESN